jgi:hypothetical protein
LSKIRTGLEILASKVDHVAARKEIQFLKFYKFWLWRQVPENWQVTRGFPVWFFLSWGIDCWTKDAKCGCGSFNHPISHCVLGTLQASKNVYLKKYVELFSRYRPIVAIFKTFSRTRSIWTNFSGILHKILTHSDWKKAKTNFDRIVSTTMGQSCGFFTRIFFSYFHCFRQHFHQFLIYSVKTNCRSKKFFNNMPKNMIFFNFCKKKTKTDETISKKLNFRRKKFWSKIYNFGP